VLFDARFLADRTVTDDGKTVGKSPLFLGDALGDALTGNEVGPGSFDRAVCTRSSSFCILPMRPRI
jgi:hypothetical protein